MDRLQRTIFILAAIGLSLGVAVVSAPTFANHSGNMYDNHNRVTLLGTVKSVIWENPHGMVILFVDPADAEFQKHSGLWWIETGSPNQLTRQGWTRQTLRSDDRISLDVSPARAESRNAFARDLKLVNGEAFAGPKE